MGNRLNLLSLISLIILNSTGFFVSESVRDKKIYVTTSATSSFLYTLPISIWTLAGKTVKAIATLTGMSDSTVATLTGV